MRAVVIGALSHRLAIALKHPDLLMERGTSMESGDAMLWDRAIVLLGALLLPTVSLIVAGFDHRFAWTAVLPTECTYPDWSCSLPGYALGAWAMAVNRFFSAVVRIQEGRDHAVVAGGRTVWCATRPTQVVCWPP